VIVDRLRGQRGQTTAEYMGLLVVVGAMIAALAASGLGTMVTAGVERAICLSVGDGPCPTVQAQLAQGGEEDDEVREDAQQRERRELERARAEFKDVQARAMTAMAGSTRPLSEVQGQSPGDWVLGGLGELSGVNDADRGVTQLGEGDFLGGAFSLAMAWPGAKAFKLGKEGIEEVGEQVAGRQAGQDATKGARGGAGPVRLGQAGEDAVRGAYDIGRKIKVDVAGTKRIPDGLTPSTLSEVKNVGSLSYTRQVRDFEQYARQTGRTFDLYVRPGARLSGPLRNADAAGRINIREIPR
jgi:hypothetical protein